MASNFFKEHSICELIDGRLFLIASETIFALPIILMNFITILNFDSF